MQSSQTEIIPIIGTSMGGGFYLGRGMENGKAYALIGAPKAQGERSGAWNGKLVSVKGALSHSDSMANTIAMAEAGSELATWMLKLKIAGETDWCLPAQDALEIMYRNAKPTSDQNSLYARSGINVSAIPPTYPYTLDSPQQTMAELFKAGGSEAFERAGYWSSTQRADSPDYAWVQYFDNGFQDSNRKSGNYLARAVRKLFL